MSVKWTVTMDCAHPATLVAFWNLALGYVDAPPPEGFATWPEWFAAFGVPPEEWGDGAYIEDPGGAGPSISFLKVPEPKMVKNRGTPRRACWRGSRGTVGGPLAQGDGGGQTTHCGWGDSHP